MSNRIRREHPERSPRRIFTRTGSVLSATTYPGKTRFAVRSLCLFRQCGQPNTRLTRSLLWKSHRPRRDFCLLPPETSVALSGTTFRNSWRPFRGSLRDTRAAISKLKCRQEGDAAVDRDRPASPHHAMMPSQSILHEWHRRELRCNSETPIFGGAMPHMDIERP